MRLKAYFKEDWNLIKEKGSIPDINKKTIEKFDKEIFDKINNLIIKISKELENKNIDLISSNKEVEEKGTKDKYNNWKLRKNKNWIICSPEIGVFFDRNEYFNTTPSEDRSSNIIEKIGTFMNTDVYKDPYIPPFVVIVGLGKNKILQKNNIPHNKFTEKLKEDLKNGKYCGIINANANVH